jgi:hypothetical protein
MIDRSDLYACTFLVCANVHAAAGSPWTWVWLALLLAVKWPAFVRVLRGWKP